jgi:signal transduction histidine kinase
MAEPGRSRTRPMTLGRSFLLWLLGVLVVTMVVVSALVLWHEQRILESELRARADLLAHILALGAADGGSPEYLAIFSMTDVRAGEVRDEDGRVLWRYGPSPGEVEALDASLLKVQRRVEIGRGPWGGGDAVDVVLLVSRARVRAHLAVAAVRLLAGLGIALTLALVAGLALIGRIVRPLHELAEWVRGFDPDQPVSLPVEGGPTAEVRDLAVAFRDMGDRLAEQRHSLLASERRFRELFTASPTPLLRLDRNLCLRDANPASEPYLGGAASRTIGSSLAGFLERPSAEEVAAAVAAAGPDSESVLEAYWRLEGGEPAEVELHVGWAGAAAAQGYLVAIHDLTDRVRRMGERWRRTFDAMVDGVALVDREGRIALANQSLEPHQHKIAYDLGPRLRGAAPRTWRTENVGRLLECSLSMPEGLEHSILVVRDITEAVDAEERLRDAEKMQAVGTLASGVAHDFNNLLAAILLHARLLQRQPQASAEAVTAIRDLAEQGTEVVHELLVFARRESPSPKTVDLVELAQLQEGVLRHLLPAEVELVLELENEPVPVKADVVGLRRLLLNLVLNARDAVSDGGGRITVRIEHTAGRAVLEVADDGQGIPVEARDHLFEPFFTQRRQGRGAGLGLAVVYGIVSALGGEVDVQSTPGEGARFIIRIPLGEVAALEPIDASPPVSAADARVLLVEADGRSASRMVENLAGAGFEVRHAPSFEIAADLLERWTPKVVVVSGAWGSDAAVDRFRGLQLPVLLLGESESGGDGGWGARAARLRSDESPEAVIETLRDLGVVPTD